jgi:hypothetical protein
MGFLQALYFYDEILRDLKKNPRRSVIFRWFCKRLHYLLNCFLPNNSSWLTDTDLGDIDLERNDFYSEFSVSVSSLV